jgi:hypothetical protein
MQPVSAPSCKSNRMLRTRLHADLKVYRDAVEQMDIAAMKGIGAKEFDKLAKRTTSAQQAFLLARERLNGHLAGHGCE